MSKSPREKIIFGVTTFCYLAAVIFIVVAAMIHVKAENDPRRAAYVAGALYFFGCGVILQVAVKMMRGDRKDDEE